ncbi:MAG: tRNA (adenosine(37)-N6)-dimethylallyltransferase MiaA [Anaerosomatales bacterium]|nr:tRNA (adenosine(37)-N6)-dimethylallyltransferase MiaA [Anaerosomatales bacterium]
MTPADQIERTSTMVLAVVGPTAVGKTALADRLAALAHGEVVSADSMQVYRGMDIGTAKPTAAERSVAYHCIDLVAPGEPYSAALFQRDARAAIDDIASRGRLPVLAGGTGLYVRAALDDMRFPRGELETETRDRLEALAAELGPEGIHDVLAQRDPDSAALIHPRNVRRTIRALEMAEQGVSYAEQAARFRERRALYDACLLGLDMDRDALYARIDARVDAMLAAGLLAEVERLLDAGYRDALTAAQAIGYKELVPVLEGAADLPDAVAAIKQASRRYAKRQLTWFRADPRVRWLDVTDSSPSENVERARTLVESWAPGLLGT